jgi:uncharacterized protein
MTNLVPGTPVHRLDWHCGSLAEGLASYRTGEFFAAHEHWELVWLGLAEPEKSFLQSLIQMTAAFHHLHTRNRVGAASLLRRTLRRLELCPGHFGGIDVAPLRIEIGAWLLAIESGAQFIPVAAPEICVAGPQEQ